MCVSVHVVRLLKFNIYPNKKICNYYDMEVHEYQNENEKIRVYLHQGILRVGSKPFLEVDCGPFLVPRSIWSYRMKKKVFLVG